MKRTTYLKIMGLGWCTPQFMFMAPFVLVAVVCGLFEDLFTWARMEAEVLSAKVGNTLYPPAWWPSHRYLNELNEIRAVRRQEAVDRLHGK